MSGTVNKVILISYLGADPRVARTAAGKPVVSFSVATSESWRDAAGTRHEATDWHGVVVFSEPLADFAAKYLRKGSKVYVEGKQKTREYEDRGVKKRITEVVLTGFNCRLDSLDKAEGRPAPPDDPDAYGTPRPASSATADDFDEIPL